MAVIKFCRDFTACPWVAVLLKQRCHWSCDASGGGTSQSETRASSSSALISSSKDSASLLLVNIHVQSHLGGLTLREERAVSCVYISDSILQRDVVVRNV